MFELAGKTAVVTGSSSGIGRAIAMELAAAGANVLVHALCRHRAAQAVALSIRDLGRQSVVVLADLAEPANHAALVNQAWQWAGNVDIWINNAGVDVLTGDTAQLSFEEKIERLWRVDVLSTIALSRLAGRRMMARSDSETHC